jgi:uncharacterized protein YuzE
LATRLDVTKRIIAMNQVELIRDTQANMSYLTLPGHPGRGTSGCVADSVPIDQLIPGYTGVDLILDFDRHGCLIGIEIFSAA